MTKKHSPFLLAGVAITLPIAVVLIVAEVVLQFMPVSTGVRPQAVNAQNEVFRAEPDRHYGYSKDWDFKLANEGRINNAGFVNDQDYDATQDTPLIAVVGDSYVEALMVPYAETLQGRLANHFEGQARVYSFAFSGAPLSQYLVWAQHARDQYQPQRLIVTVVGNDFDESLMGFKRAPGLHHYVRSDDGTLSLERVDYTPNALNRNVVNKSALGNYLLRNLLVMSVPARLKEMFAASPRTETFVGNTSASVDPERVEQSKAAVRAFLDDLQTMSGLAAQDIALVIDGNRLKIYEDDRGSATEQAYFDIMRTYFMSEARRIGYHVIDMHESFSQAYRRDGKRFEYPTDGHWSGYGHGIAADAVVSSGWLDGFKKP